MHLKCIFKITQKDIPNKSYFVFYPSGSVKSFMENILFSWHITIQFEHMFSRHHACWSCQSNVCGREYVALNIESQLDNLRTTSWQASDSSKPASTNSNLGEDFGLLGNILNKFYGILSHFTICRKLCSSNSAYEPASKTLLMFRDRRL